ncbi:hypothetical protein, partial [Albidovulum sp.]|uniref:hypothetical protein n=1 Tax=Albidovulum sp. TaxID=1872424 RepID=UPI003D7C7126
MTGDELGKFFDNVHHGEPLRYSRDGGYRTAKITFPFKVLADFSTQKCDLVEQRGIEPLTSSLRTTR